MCVIALAINHHVAMSLDSKKVLVILLRQLPQYVVQNFAFHLQVSKHPYIFKNKRFAGIAFTGDYPNMSSTSLNVISMKINQRLFFCDKDLAIDGIFVLNCSINVDTFDDGVESKLGEFSKSKAGK